MAALSTRAGCDEVEHQTAEKPETARHETVTHGPARIARMLHTAVGCARTGRLAGPRAPLSA
jgi:hypothetical protein